MGKTNRPSKKHYTGKDNKRLIIEGFHPNDERRISYAFLASNYLASYCRDNDIAGKVVLVENKYGYRPLYVTGVHTWTEDELVPERIAMALYGSKKYRDYKPD